MATGHRSDDREVEFPVSYAPEKGMPLIRREPQDRPRGIPAVAEADLTPGQTRHLDAVAGGVAQRALDPARTRIRPFVWTPERRAHVSPQWLVSFRKLSHQLQRRARRGFRAWR